MGIPGWEIGDFGGFIEIFFGGIGLAFGAAMRI